MDRLSNPNSPSLGQEIHSGSDSSTGSRSLLGGTGGNPVRPSIVVGKQSTRNTMATLDTMEIHNGTENQTTIRSESKSIRGEGEAKGKGDSSEHGISRIESYTGDQVGKANTMETEFDKALSAIHNPSRFDRALDAWCDSKILNWTEDNGEWLGFVFFLSVPFAVPVLSWILDTVFK